MKMENMLPDNKLVTMVRRGGPVMDHSGYHTLPVDLIWVVVIIPDSFSARGCDQVQSDRVHCECIWNGRV